MRTPIVDPVWESYRRNLSYRIKKIEGNIDWDSIESLKSKLIELHGLEFSNTMKKDTRDAVVEDYYMTIQRIEQRLKELNKNNEDMLAALAKYKAIIEKEAGNDTKNEINDIMTNYSNLTIDDIDDLNGRITKLEAHIDTIEDANNDFNHEWLGYNDEFNSEYEKSKDLRASFLDKLNLLKAKQSVLRTEQFAAQKRKEALEKYRAEVLEYTTGYTTNIESYNLENLPISELANVKGFYGICVDKAAKLPTHDDIYNDDKDFMDIDEVLKACVDKVKAKRDEAKRTLDDLERRTALNVKVSGYEATYLSYENIVVPMNVGYANFVVCKEKLENLIGRDGNAGLLGLLKSSMADIAHLYIEGNPSTAEDTRYKELKDKIDRLTESANAKLLGESNSVKYFQNKYNDILEAKQEELNADTNAIDNAIRDMARQPQGAMDSKSMKIFYNGLEPLLSKKRISFPPEWVDADGVTPFQQGLKDINDKPVTGYLAVYDRLAKSAQVFKEKMEKIAKDYDEYVKYYTAITTAYLNNTVASVTYTTAEYRDIPALTHKVDTILRSMAKQVDDLLPAYAEDPNLKAKRDLVEKRKADLIRWQDEASTHLAVAKYGEKVDELCKRIDLAKQYEPFTDESVKSETELQRVNNIIDTFNNRTRGFVTKLYDTNYVLPAGQHSDYLIAINKTKDAYLNEIGNVSPDAKGLLKSLEDTKIKISAYLEKRNADIKEYTDYLTTIISTARDGKVLNATNKFDLDYYNANVVVSKPVLEEFIRLVKTKLLPMTMDEEKAILTDSQCKYNMYLDDKISGDKFQDIFRQINAVKNELSSILIKAENDKAEMDKAEENKTPEEKKVDIVTDFFTKKKEAIEDVVAPSVDLESYSTTDEKRLAVDSAILDINNKIDSVKRHIEDCDARMAAIKNDNSLTKESVEKLVAEKDKAIDAKTKKIEELQAQLEALKKNQAHLADPDDREKALAKYKAFNTDHVVIDKTPSEIYSMAEKETVAQLKKECEDAKAAIEAGMDVPELYVNDADFQEVHKELEAKVEKLAVTIKLLTDQLSISKIQNSINTFINLVSSTDIADRQQFPRDVATMDKTELKSYRDTINDMKYALSQVVNVDTPACDVLQDEIDHDIDDVRANADVFNSIGKAIEDFNTAKKDLAKLHSDLDAALEACKGHLAELDKALYDRYNVWRAEIITLTSELTDALGGGSNHD